MSPRFSKKNTLHWAGPGTIVALLIGSGISLWIQALNMSLATSTIPTASNNATVLHLAKADTVSAPINLSTSTSQSESQPSIIDMLHGAASSTPAIADLTKQTQPTLVNIQISTTNARLTRRLMVGKTITFVARGFFSNAPMKSKIIRANFSINGTAVDGCQNASVCAFKPETSGAYTIRLSAADKIASLWLKVR